MRRSPVLVILPLIAGALFALALAAPAIATTLAPWTLNDFVVNMNAAVTGTVTRVDVRWNDDRTLIHSHVTIAVDQIVAGEQLPAELVLVEMGGRVGRTLSVVEGVPVYREGERVFVFVERVDDIYRTLGFYQGKYTLEVDPVTQREVFVQRVPADGVVIAGPDGVKEPAPVVYGREELIERVRELGGVK
jgi:hypothetical protein